MRFAIIAIGAAAALVALPAQARDHQKKYPNLGAAIAAGCKVQQVHTPGGKGAMVEPSVRCDGMTKPAAATTADLPVTPSVAR